MSARAAFSQIADAPAALEQAWEASGASLERSPDFVALFCAGEHSGAAHELRRGALRAGPGRGRPRERARPTASSAPGREQQDGAALALLAVTLPAGARVTSFHTQIGEGLEGPELVGLPAPPAGSLVVAIADPHSTPVEQLVEGLGGVPLLGGFAGLGGPGAARLFTNAGCVEEGAVGVVLDGLPARPIVSQGARPIGPEMVVTAAEGNLILELAGRSALERVQQVVAELAADRAAAARERPADRPRDRREPPRVRPRRLPRARGSRRRLEHGCARDRRRPAHRADRAPARARRGVGLARARRAALAAGGRAGLRGASVRVQRPRPQPLRQDDHDAGAVARLLRSDAVAGCFCQGELGPVGGRTFVHGFTASVALW